MTSKREAARIIKQNMATADGWLDKAVQHSSLSKGYIPERIAAEYNRLNLDRPDFEATWAEILGLLEELRKIVKDTTLSAKGGKA